MLNEKGQQVLIVSYSPGAKPAIYDCLVDFFYRLLFKSTDGV